MRAHEGLLVACGRFLRSQYLTPTGRLSSTVVRDVFMRCAYIAPQLTTFSTIESACLRAVRRQQRES